VTKPAVAAVSRLPTSPRSQGEEGLPGALDNGGGPDGWRALLKYTAGSQAHPPVVQRCLENVLTTLRHCPEWRGVVRYNAFTDRVELVGALPQAPSHRVTFQPGPWREGYSLWVAAWLHDRLGFEVSIDMVERAIDEIARQTPWHPVRDYLHDLRWDGKPRLATMLSDFFGADDTEVTRAIGAKWMISAVARVMEPGCQVDHILVLEGPQGTRKSSALKVLVGEEWFRNSAIDIRGKDAVMALRGCWVYELDELDGLRGRDATRVKSFLTCRRDSYRPAYGRRVVDVPRECVFAASTNEERYLVDTTGNRRFWPVRCRTIEVDRLASLRDQLWAEAAYRYCAGEPWHIDSSQLAAQFRQEQADREEIDPWVGLTNEWLSGLDQADHSNGVTTHRALVEGLRQNPGSTTRRDETRMGGVLKALGWEKRRVRDRALREYRYYPPAAPTRPYAATPGRPERNSQ
jgi:putative DNA primase/helicase